MSQAEEEHARACHGNPGLALRMAVACVEEGTAFVVENGAVYACGDGEYGLLGLNSREHHRLPARVGGAEVHGGSPVLIVAACGLHRANLTEDGAMWTFGCGSDGRLGHGDAHDRLRPTRLGPEALWGLPVVLVACGSFHKMALACGGCVWTACCSAFRPYRSGARGVSERRRTSCWQEWQVAPSFLFMLPSPVNGVRVGLSSFPHGSLPFTNLRTVTRTERSWDKKKRGWVQSEFLGLFANHVHFCEIGQS